MEPEVIRSVAKARPAISQNLRVAPPFFVRAEETLNGSGLLLFCVAEQKRTRISRSWNMQHPRRVASRALIRLAASLRLREQKQLFRQGLDERWGF